MNKTQLKRLKELMNEINGYYKIVKQQIIATRLLLLLESHNSMSKDSAVKSDNFRRTPHVRSAERASRHLLP